MKYTSYYPYGGGYGSPPNYWYNDPYLRHQLCPYCRYLLSYYGSVQGPPHYGYLNRTRPYSGWPNIPTPNIPTPNIPTPNIPTPNIPNVPTPNIPTPNIPTPNVSTLPPISLDPPVIPPVSEITLPPLPNIHTPWPGGGGSIQKQIVGVVNHVTGQVVQQVNHVTEEAKSRARQEWENLKSQSQAYVMQQVNNQFEALKQEAVQAGMDWVHTNYGTLEEFANQAIEWGMEIRDAIVRVQEMVRMLKSLLSNFNKHCSTPYSQPISLMSVNIPIINKSYKIAIEICYPFNPNTIAPQILKTCQDTTIQQASQTIMQGVAIGAASGGTGIIPALSESFTRAMSEAPGVFATCLQNQATQAAGRIELRILMG